MKTSPAGIGLITEFEGFPNGGRPYNDPVGLATVGYGHLIAHRRVTQGDRAKRWIRGQRTPGVLTQIEAAALLSQDLRPREQVVADLVDVPLTQSQFDALVSLVYNIGERAFANSTVLRRLNAGDYRGAADAFLMWNKAGSPPRPLEGLTRRRKAERARFLGGGGRPASLAPEDDGAEDPFAGYTEHEVRLIREYDRLKREQRDVERRRALRREMTAQRKRIWRRAQPVQAGGDGKGWDHHARRDRYHSLLSRTT